MVWPAGRSEQEHVWIWSGGDFYEGKALYISPDLEWYDVLIEGSNPPEMMAVKDPEEVHFPSMNLVIRDVHLENLEKFPLSLDSYDLSKNSDYVDRLRMGEEYLWPPTVRPVGDEVYQVVDGNKSLQIAREELDLDSVKCEVYCWHDTHAFHKFIDNHIDVDERNGEEDYSTTYTWEEIDEVLIKAFSSQKYRSLATENKVIKKALNHPESEALEKMVDE